MKFLAALLASASAAEYEIWTLGINHYADADTTCASTTSFSGSILAIIGQCTYSPGVAAWFKLTEATAATAKIEWYADGACSGSAAADQKQDFTALNTCAAGKKTGSSISHHSKLPTAPVQDGTSKVCGFTLANNSGTSDCNTPANLASAPLLPAQGMNGGPWVVSVCYFMKASNYFKITKCTDANNWTVEWHTDDGCLTAATPPNASCTACADACVLNAFAAGSSYKVSAVISTHTVKAAPAVAPAATTGAKTLVTGALAAVSMMYL